MKAGFKWGRCVVHEKSHTGEKLVYRRYFHILVCPPRAGKHENLKTGSIFNVKNLDHSTAGGIHLLRLIALKISEIGRRTRSRLRSVIDVDVAWNEP
jgi:hypothetical protein